VVAVAKQFAPTQCRSATECFKLTRDVSDAVRLMIDGLRAPSPLNADWVAPWLAYSGT
jgi:hypothetical protein